MSLKGKAAAIGIAELKPWKEAPPDVTPLKLMGQLTAVALSDAGLEKNDIDGFLVGMPFADPGMLYPASACEVLGINPRMLNVVDIGGATPAGMIWRAAAARRTSRTTTCSRRSTCRPTCRGRTWARSRPTSRGSSTSSARSCRPGRRS